MLFSMSLLAVGLMATSVIAHFETKRTIADTQRRAQLSKRCAPAVAASNEKRYAKRILQRKQAFEKRGNVTYTITTEAPYYNVIPNNQSCVFDPDAIEGPYYWPRADMLRQDITEDQDGIPLWLDIGVIDIATCKPVENALVDVWHANATGSYSSFSRYSPDLTIEEMIASLNLTYNYTMGITDIHTDDETFLRGLWPTDSDGIIEMKTILPGWYSGRSIHIHAMAHLDWVLTKNGTILESRKISRGQFYINETFTQQYLKEYPYTKHMEKENVTRTTNDVDRIYSDAMVPGNDPDIQFDYVNGIDFADGVIGYTTIGVDTIRYDIQAPLNPPL
ncbi:unnamed protein product [Diplocarpon coronariae]